MNRTILVAGTIPAATKRLEAVLRRARELDRDLLELFRDVQELRSDLEAAGVRSIEFGFPMLVGHAHELYEGLGDAPPALFELPTVET